MLMGMRGLFAWWDRDGASMALKGRMWRLWRGRVMIGVGPRGGVVEAWVVEEGAAVFNVIPVLVVRVAFCGRRCKFGQEGAY